MPTRSGASCNRKDNPSEGSGGVLWLRGSGMTHVGSVALRLLTLRNFVPIILRLLSCAAITQVSEATSPKEEVSRQREVEGGVEQITGGADLARQFIQAQLDA